MCAGTYANIIGALDYGVPVLVVGGSGGACDAIEYIVRHHHRERDDDRDRDRDRDRDETHDLDDETMINTLIKKQISVTYNDDDPKRDEKIHGIEMQLKTVLQHLKDGASIAVFLLGCHIRGVRALIDVHQCPDVHRHPLAYSRMRMHTSSTTNTIGAWWARGGAGRGGVGQGGRVGVGNCQN